MSRVIPIHSNNGWDMCQSCEFCDSDTCAFCDEGDQYEPGESAQDMQQLERMTA